MEKLKQMQEDMIKIKRKIALRKFHKSIEMMKNGENIEDVDELKISTEDWYSLEDLLKIKGLKHGKDFFVKQSSTGELGNETYYSSLYLKTEGSFIHFEIVEDSDRECTQTNIQCLEDVPTLYDEGEDEYEEVEDEEATKYFMAASDLDFDLLEEDIDLNLAGNTHKGEANNAIEMIVEQPGLQADNLSGMSFEELEKKLQQVQTDNKVKQEELRKQQLIAQIRLAQQTGKELDRQIREANSKDRGE